MKYTRKHSYKREQKYTPKQVGEDKLNSHDIVIFISPGPIVSFQKENGVYASYFTLRSYSASHRNRPEELQYRPVTAYSSRLGKYVGKVRRVIGVYPSLTREPVFEVIRTWDHFLKNVEYMKYANGVYERD